MFAKGGATVAPPFFMEYSWSVFVDGCASALPAPILGAILLESRGPVRLLSVEESAENQPPH
jgi:hypothetical protein